MKQTTARFCTRLLALAGVILMAGENLVLAHGGKDEDGFLPWLAHNGLMIQIFSGAVVVAGIAAFFALRFRRPQQTPSAQQPPARESASPNPPSPVQPDTGTNPKSRGGMTLVELLVVLVILIILTTIAVQSATGIVDQSRYDATQRTLQNVQNAIMGQRGTDGNPLIGNFLADMGRLPMPAYSNGALVDGDPLSELWDPAAIATNLGSLYNPSPITIPSANGPQTAAATLLTAIATPLTVTIPCGWRGPYLQLPTGHINLVDGWGNSLRALYQPPATIQYPPLSVQLGQPINAVCSLGADSMFDTMLPTNPYNEDQYVPTQATIPPTTPLANFSQVSYGSISITVQSINTTVTPVALTNPYKISESNPKVRVVLFAPVNGAMTAFILDSTSVANNPHNPTLNPATYLNAMPYFPNVPNPNPVDFAISTSVISGSSVPQTTPVNGSFYNVPVGPRAIQAFQYDAATMVITKKSPLTYINVPAANVTTTLILQ